MTARDKHANTAELGSNLQHEGATWLTSAWAGEPQSHLALSLPTRVADRVEDYAKAHGLEVRTAIKCLITAGLEAEAETLLALEANDTADEQITPSGDPK